MEVTILAIHNDLVFNENWSVFKEAFKDTNIKLKGIGSKNLADEIDRKVRERFMQESKREQLKNKDEEEKSPAFTTEAPKAPARRPGSVRAKIDILVDDDDE